MKHDVLCPDCRIWVIVEAPDDADSVICPQCSTQISMTTDSREENAANPIASLSPQLARAVMVSYCLAGITIITSSVIGYIRTAAGITFFIAAMILTQWTFDALMGTGMIRRLLRSGYILSVLLFALTLFAWVASYSRTSFHVYRPNDDKSFVIRSWARHVSCFWVNDEVAQRRGQCRCGAALCVTCVLGRYRPERHKLPLLYWHLGLRGGVPSHDSRYRTSILGFYWGTQGVRGAFTGTYRYCVLPYWGVAALTGIVPVFLLLRVARRMCRLRRQQRFGLCVKCGYDLRASRQRCPECGHAIDEGTIVERALVDRDAAKVQRHQDLHDDHTRHGGRAAVVGDRAREHA